jgi:hypothetical protein
MNEDRLKSSQSATRVQQVPALPQAIFNEISNTSCLLGNI